MDSANSAKLEIRIRSSSDKGNYKVETNGTLQSLLSQLLIHEEIIKKDDDFGDLVAKI